MEKKELDTGNLLLRLGLPFPSIQALEWKSSERMILWEKKVRKNT